MKPSDRRGGIGGADLVVAEAGGAEEVVVFADGFGGGGDLFGVALAEVLVALQEGAAEGDPLGEAPPRRQGERAVAVEVRGAGDQAGVLPGLVVEGDLFQGVVDARGQVRGRRRWGPGRARAISGAGSIGSPTWTRTRERKVCLASKRRPTGTIRAPRPGNFRSASRTMRAAPVFSGLRAGSLWLVPSGKRASAPLRQQLVAAGEGLVVLRRGPTPRPAGGRRGWRRRGRGRGGRGVLPEGALGEEPRRPPAAAPRAGAGRSGR